MVFIQTPPELGNQYTSDRALRELLVHALPADVLHEIEAALVAMGELGGGEIYRMLLADRGNEPVLTQWDAWGNRIDRIEVSPLWLIVGWMLVLHLPYVLSEITKEAAKIGA